MAARSIAMIDMKKLSGILKGADKEFSGWIEDRSSRSWTHRKGWAGTRAVDCLRSKSLLEPIIN